jgi:hypothetical protein
MVEWTTLVDPVIKVLVGGVGGWYAREYLEKLQARRPLDSFIEQDTSIIFGNIPDWASFPYYFNCNKDQLPLDPPARGVDWWSWVKDNHGMAAIHSELAVTLCPRAEQTVLIDSFRVRSLRVVDATPGCIVTHPVGGADITHRQVDIRLQPFCPYATFREAGSREERKGFSFALKKGEPARISVTTRAEDNNHCYEWVGQLDVVAGGKRRTIQVADQGRPFKLHGGGNCKTYQWIAGQWDEWSTSLHEA